MSGSIQFRAILKKLISDLKKSLKIQKTNPSAKQFEDARLALKQLYTLLSIFESFFQSHAHHELKSVLMKNIELLEDLRIQNATLRLFQQFSPNGKAKHEPHDGVQAEFEVSRKQAMAKALKELGRLKVPAIEKTLLQKLDLGDEFEFRSIVKVLNSKREHLFDYIVHIIRSTQKEQYDNLRLEVENFCSLLDFAVRGGYEKGKRLLQVLKGLRTRLVDIQNEDTFRSIMQNLEIDSANNPKKVANVVRLREIRLRLGVFQAETLRNLHGHLPVSLQLLKRNLVWKD